MFSVEMRARGLSEITKELRNLDRKAANAMRAKLRSAIIPTAKEIAGTVPPNPPLSGMGPNTRRGGNPVNGVTRWTGVPKASVSFTPGRAKSNRSQNILSMKFTGGTRNSGGIGFDYAELAGISNRPSNPYSRVYDRNGVGGYQHRINGQGRSFIEGIRRARSIRGRGGYYVFDAAVKRYGKIEGLGRRAIDQFMRDVTREIRRQKYGF